jgi:hypothetical protein
MRQDLSSSDRYNQMQGLSISESLSEGLIDADDLIPSFSSSDLDPEYRKFKLWCNMNDYIVPSIDEWKKEKEEQKEKKKREEEDKKLKEIFNDEDYSISRTHEVQ